MLKGPGETLEGYLLYPIGMVTFMYPSIGLDHTLMLNGQANQLHDIKINWGVHLVTLINVMYLL